MELGNYQEWGKSDSDVAGDMEIQLFRSSCFQIPLYHFVLSLPYMDPCLLPLTIVLYLAQILGLVVKVKQGGTGRLISNLC